MGMLDQAYPDITPEHQRVAEFFAVKQKQPLIEVYNMKKKAAWERAYGAVDPASRSDYISHWVDGLHPMIKAKIHKQMEIAALDGSGPISLDDLEKSAHKYQYLMKDKPQYAAHFRGNTNAVQSDRRQGKGQAAGGDRNRRRCHFYGTEEGCRRGQNCTFVHQANQNATSSSSSSGQRGNRQGNA